MRAVWQAGSGVHSWLVTQTTTILTADVANAAGVQYMCGAAAVLGEPTWRAAVLAEVVVNRVATRVILRRALLRCALHTPK